MIQTPSLFAHGTDQMATVCERLAAYGAELLSDEEALLPMLDSTSTDKARAILFQSDGFNGLLKMGLAQLQELGLSALESSRIIVLAEVYRRSSRHSNTRITSPKAATAYLIQRCAGFTEEVFGMLALNAKGDVMADWILSKGTASACMVSPREFFRAALQAGASSALAYHNHPSGDPSPSREDTALTKRLRSAGESLGVPLADHIVVGDCRATSFRAAEGWDANP